MYRDIFTSQGVLSMLVIMLYMSLLMDLATLSARLSTYVLAPWPAVCWRRWWWWVYLYETCWCSGWFSWFHHLVFIGYLWKHLKWPVDGWITMICEFVMILRQQTCDCSTPLLNNQRLHNHFFHGIYFTLWFLDLRGMSLSNCGEADRE